MHVCPVVSKEENEGFQTKEVFRKYTNKIEQGKIESEWNAVVKRAQEETGLGPDSDIIDHFSSTQEQIISKQINDMTVKEQTVQEEKSNTGRIYRAYVLMEFDEGAAEKRLLAQIKADEHLYTAIRATELYNEMEDKVAKYRERYGK